MHSFHCNNEYLYFTNLSNISQTSSGEINKLAAIMQAGITKARGAVKTPNKDKTKIKISKMIKAPVKVKLNRFALISAS